MSELWTTAQETRTLPHSPTANVHVSEMTKYSMSGWDIFPKPALNLWFYFASIHMIFYIFNYILTFEENILLMRFWYKNVDQNEYMNNWATSKKKKLPYAICEQQRRRSACTSVQPAHPRSLISTFIAGCLDSIMLILANFKISGL